MTTTEARSQNADGILFYTFYGLPVHWRIYFIVWIFHTNVFAKAHANVIFIGCTTQSALKNGYSVLSALRFHLIIWSYCFSPSSLVILSAERCILTHQTAAAEKNYLWLHLIHLLDKFFCPTAFSHSLCTADAFSILQCGAVPLGECFRSSTFFCSSDPIFSTTIFGLTSSKLVLSKNSIR